MKSNIENVSIGFEHNADKKHQICDRILRNLPEWFGIEEAIVDYADTVRSLPFVTASDGKNVIGFCAIKVHYGINADLYVLGIIKKYHRLGIGTRMLAFTEGYMRENRIPYLTVKTLSERHPDKNYADTRAFYKHFGFQPFEELLSLWGEANPCLNLLKKVDQNPLDG
ncbi:MAG: GNAT family N-acetyltransferase [Spirochaetales bacterium]|jgi:ribosomal protein S18 acetylase RimI-like enzyme|nr:GNAT family N-acetyltransferase [Spirochaetales bacterium]